MTAGKAELANRTQEPIVGVSQDAYELRYAAYHIALALDGAALEATDSSSSAGTVLAIAAPWGMGKTSVVNLLRRLYLPGATAPSSEPATKVAPSTNTITNLLYRFQRPVAVAQSATSAASVSLDSPVCDEELESYIHTRVDDRDAARQFLRELSRGIPRRRIFVDFSAWTDGNHVDLTISLLENIGDTLSDRKSLRNQLGRFARLVRRHGVPVVNNLIAVGGLASFVTGVVTGSQAAAVGGPNADFSWGSGDVEASLERLTERLNQSREHLTLVIDDIDRMSPRRIEDLIVAIWRLRDLPNISFLLLFDHGIVVDGLARTMFGGGQHHQQVEAAHRFLEKIVQFSFQLPQPSRGALVHEIEHGLKQTSGLAGLCSLFSDLSGQFEGELRWTAIKNLVLSRMVTTPRAVNRLINTLTYTWPMKSFRRIDGRDLIAIEAIAMFRPELIVTLRQLKDMWELNLAVDLPAILPNPQDRRIAELLYPSRFGHEMAQDVQDRHGFGELKLVDDYLLGSRVSDFRLDYDFDAVRQGDVKSVCLTLSHALYEGKLASLVRSYRLKIANEPDNEDQARTLYLALRKLEDGHRSGPHAPSVAEEAKDVLSWYPALLDAQHPAS